MTNLITPGDTALHARFLAKVRADEVTGCHLWTGARDRNGYGVINLTGPRRLRKAHRVAYTLFAGPIPDGAEIDHTCHTRDTTCDGTNCPHRACVNPAHLEAVTHHENVLRGRSFAAREAQQTHCRRRGHALEGDNLYRAPRSGRRVCRACKRDSNAERRKRLREAVAAP